MNERLLETKKQLIKQWLFMYRYNLDKVAKCTWIPKNYLYLFMVGKIDMEEDWLDEILDTLKKLK